MCQCSLCILLRLILYQSSELESSLMVWPGFAGSDVRAPSVIDHCVRGFMVSSPVESQMWFSGC